MTKNLGNARLTRVRLREENNMSSLAKAVLEGDKKIYEQSETTKFTRRIHLRIN